MGLGHIKPGLPAAQAAGTGIFHPTMTHPKTGEPLEAVYVTKRGVVMWPVMGASPDDDSNDDGGDDDADDDSDDDDDDDSGDDNDGDDTDGKKAKAKIKALEEEKDRHYKRRKKAETERDALKAELEALKAKNGGKKTKPKADDKNDDADSDDDGDDEEKVTLRKNNEEQAAELRKAKIENAFLAVQSTNKIEWVNPGHVMTLLMADDDYEVEFTDNGNVDRKSLAAELKRFAKANQHLVKPKPKQSDGDGDKPGDGDDQNNGSNKSGSSMNGQRKGKGKQAPTREQLAKKYPALNQR